MKNLKWWGFLCGVALLVFYLLPLFESPEDQVRNQHRKLLEAIHNGDLPTVRSLFSPAYKDPWFNSSEETLESLGIASRYLRRYELHTGDLTLQQKNEGSQIQVSHTIKLFPKQSPSFPHRELPSAEWEFIWEKEDSWRPNWKLLSVNHPEFVLDHY